MKYTCKLIIKNNLSKESSSYFKMSLKYKGEGKIFYKEVTLLFYDCYINGYTVKGTLIPELNRLGKMSEEEFMDMIRKALMEKLNIKESDDSLYKQLDESLGILQDRCKKFTIEI